MSYFVITRRFDGEPSYHLMADAPRAESKEDRRAHVAVVHLSKKADGLTLSALKSLYNANALVGDLIVAPPPPAKKQEEKRAPNYRDPLPVRAHNPNPCTCGSDKADKVRKK